ncbi:hypothetical protein [Bradyrhizobium liaoningense]|uniref:hypothetical protein n=1 Tax=Bradyrhizobium liaoningense TaxID=43992 RepID=UPI002012410E|nr:hypothetical protein [Bradyrhizobium liaoningense]
MDCAHSSSSGRNCEALAASDPNNRALDTLLSLLASRYIDAFYEEPVPVSIADGAFVRFLKTVDCLDLQKPADGRLNDLNRVAAIDLVAQPPVGIRLSGRNIGRVSCNWLVSAEQ